MDLTKVINQFNRSALTRLEINNLILEEVNNTLETDIDYPTEFKELELNSYDDVAN